MPTCYNIRIGVEIFLQPSVASYEYNAKRNTGLGLVVVEYLYPTGIHFAYLHIYWFLDVVVYR